MALQLTADGLRKEIEKRGGDLPYTVAAGVALGSATLLQSMNPGGAKTLACLAAFGGGSWVAATSHRPMTKSVAIGISMGGIWTLLMRK